MTHTYTNITHNRHHSISNSKHHKHNNCHDKHKHPSVSVRDTVIVSEIRDAFKNLRYKVALVSYDVYDFDGVHLTYQIDVVNCFSTAQELVIVSRPSACEGLITDQKIAYALYEDYKNKYTNLVKAETRDMQDMSIYADKVNYKLTCPACCITCKWAQKRKTPKDYVVNVTGKLECHNPKNITEYNFDIDCENSIHIKERPCPPYYKPKNDFKLTLHPNVQPFGLCDNYARRTTEYIPMPSESILNIINSHVENLVETHLSEKVKPLVTTLVEDSVDELLTTQTDNTM